MLKSQFIEDIFLEFFDFAQSKGISIAQQDQTAANGFYTIIYNDRQLTEAQGNYIIKILEKHKNLMAMYGFDYRPALAETPKWKQSFRTIDYSKKVFVEKNKNGRIDVCLKFPYQLKKDFEEEFEKESDFSSSTWDSTDKFRRLPLYSTNLIQVYEFVKNHNFEIDDTFLIAMGEVEEIWQNQDSIIPYATILQNVRIENVAPEVRDWFDLNSRNHMATDLFTAKSMGIPLQSRKPHSLIEKIVSSNHNQFWIKDLERFIDLSYILEGKTCIILDRADDEIKWVEHFVETVEAQGKDLSKIRVCFRQNKDEDRGFNDWVKTKGVGGPVEGGQIYIFKHKPAKWLFKDENSVKILASNGLYPHAGPVTRDWFDSHPCVIYVGNIKPTQSRNKKIVEL